MKRKRRLSGVLLIIAALIIMQLPVAEADAATSASDFKMEGTTLVKYRGKDTKVSVPNTVEIIAESAFSENDEIEKVTIPNSVTQIEPYSFWGCDNLETVELGSGIEEIDAFTFANCKGLKHMTIPSTVQSIGIQAFLDCVNMTDITIPPEVTLIHETSFDGCYKLYINCIAGSVADEYAVAFYERQEEMPEYEDVPEYQESDGTDEDNDDEANTTYQPDTTGELLGSTQIVGNSAVVFIDNASPVVLDGAQTPSEEELIDSVLQEKQGNLPKYTIVDNKIVADQAYYRDKTLGHVVLPQGIEEVGMFAFSRSSVTSVAIPEGAKDISYGAFYHCDKLEKVSLPTTIENVEPKAFDNSLWVEDFKENSTEDFLISGNVLVAYRGNDKEVIIPEGVSVIAAEVFQNDARMQSVILPESLVTIGEGAFEGCTGLKTIQVGSQLKQIKDRAFAGCPLEPIEMPKSVNEVGLKAFDEGVKVSYNNNKTPIAIHENSAERLSNEKYRNVSEETEESGVQVIGIEPAIAELEGANRSYKLLIAVAEDSTPIETAYQRCFQSEIPENMAVYDMLLADNSGIPLTKLGKQSLTITIPAPEAITQENLVVYMMDRNGQLEKRNAERVSIDGTAGIRFQTTYLSQFAICGDGNIYNEVDVLEVSTTIQSMSEAPGSSNAVIEGNGFLTYLKWGSAVILLFLGTMFVISKEKKKA